jgi:hypothetical protein
MDSFDAMSLTGTMTEAAKTKAECWSAIRVIAESEIRRFARTLEDVGKLYASGAIEEDEAFDIASTHRNAAQTVLRTTQCVSAATARRVAPRLIRAAVEAARPVVNRAIGFPLL